MATIIPSGMLLEMYRTGYFPMAGPDGEIRLFSPDPRGILPLQTFRPPHGTKKTLKDPAWRVTVDSAFTLVMLMCSFRDETWIDDTILESYEELHRLGHAHSVEVWRGSELAGGLYGVALGAAFFGESMFHRVSGASKVALCRLVEFLRAGGFELLDTQWITPHLQTFGAVEIPKRTYMRLLSEAVAKPATFPDGPRIDPAELA